MSGRLESAHAPLSFSGRLVRILGPIVQPFMRHVQPDTSAISDSGDPNYRYKHKVIRSAR